MRWLLDLLYLLVSGLAAPIWLTRMIRTGKIRTDWRGRFGRVTVSRRGSSPRLLLHAVSVGEVNAIRELVALLDASDSALEIVIATTTDTGFARAQAVFQDRHEVIRYPIDFSFAVARVLRAVRPDVVGLVELEVWPNFTAACRRMGIPVGVINGRLSARSHRRYRRIRSFVRPSFRRLEFVGAQSTAYAERFVDLGAAPDRVTVTGTMKWDTARIEDEVDGANDLARDLGIDRNRPLVVAGSTAPGEHELLHQSMSEGAQLLCAPRKPEWFDQAAAVLPGCVRRTSGQSGSTAGRFLLDTIGELRMAYGLADLVVVGRTFGDLHGSDMMEPIALGKATIAGPAVEDFRDTMDALLAGDGIVQTTTTQLSGVIAALLDDDKRRLALAEQGRAVIRSHQGASRRHADLLLSASGLTPRCDA